MQGLTHRQRQVLDFIRESISERGYPPTLREIGCHMGIRSTNGVNDHLRALERKGFLTREDMKSRALRPTDMIPSNDSSLDIDEQDDDVMKVHILGRVAAGFPILADEQIIDTVQIAPHMLGGARDVFGLRVSGDSMIEAGILNGDYIFVRRQRTAMRGDIVVALVNEEATVKYFYPEKDCIRLQPANSQMAAILVRASDFRSTMILGVVIGVFRKL